MLPHDRVLYTYFFPDGIRSVDQMGGEIYRRNRHIHYAYILRSAIEFVVVSNRWMAKHTIHNLLNA